MPVAQHSVSLVERRLGSATGRLYVAVQRMLDAVADYDQQLPDPLPRVGYDTFQALVRLNLDILCGKFHDYRSGAPMPKADLVTALRAVPPHESVSGRLSDLVEDVIAGAYADEPSERWHWVASAAPQRALPAQPRPPQPIKLADRDYKVFVWLYRYVEVYGTPPLVREIAEGCEAEPLRINAALKSLEKKGAVVGLGGPRGWIPVRAP